MREGFDFNDLDRDSVDYVLTTTRSVRRRLDLDRPVDPAVIAECLELSTQAPTGSNLQGLRWVVVTDPAIRAAVGAQYSRVMIEPSPSTGTYFELNRSNLADVDESQQTRMMGSVVSLFESIGRVPILAIPCYRGQLPQEPDLFVLATMFGSVFPAVWSFQLALRSRGLASVLTTAHLPFAADVAEILDLPEDVTQVGLVAVAHSVGTEFRPAKRRPLGDIASWNSWDSREVPS